MFSRILQVWLKVFSAQVQRKAGAAERSYTEIGFIVCACGIISHPANQTEGNMFLNSVFCFNCSGH